MTGLSFPKSKRLVSRDLLDEVKKERCLVCLIPVTDPCHIKTRGSGGPDEAWNLIPLCRREHITQGRRGWAWMATRFPQIDQALKDRGWEIDFETGKLWNEKLRSGE